MNLLEETKDDIRLSGHRPSDIIFIGSLNSGHGCTWEEFCNLADVNYDSSYGNRKVAADLRFVFSDGQQMWRHEEDGSEWWQYSEPFKRRNNSFSIKTLFTASGEMLLKDCNACHAIDDMQE